MLREQRSEQREETKGDMSSLFITAAGKQNKSEETIRFTHLCAGDHRPSTASDTTLEDARRRVSAYGTNTPILDTRRVSCMSWAKSNYHDLQQVARSRIMSHVSCRTSKRAL